MYVLAVIAMDCSIVILSVPMPVKSQRDFRTLVETKVSPAAMGLETGGGASPPDGISSNTARADTASRLRILTSDEKCVSLRPFAFATPGTYQTAASAGAAFQDLRCVDVFRGRALAAGRQAWLLRFRFQHPERTLTGEEVDAWMAAALEAAASLGAELRS